MVAYCDLSMILKGALVNFLHLLPGPLPAKLAGLFPTGCYQPIHFVSVLQDAYQMINQRCYIRWLEQQPGLA